MIPRPLSRGRCQIPPRELTFGEWRLERDGPLVPTPYYTAAYPWTKERDGNPAPANRA